jgi:hypothetical protein
MIFEVEKFVYRLEASSKAYWEISLSRKDDHRFMGKAEGPKGERIPWQDTDCAAVDDALHEMARRIRASTYQVS